LVIFCAVALTPATAVAAGLSFSLAVDAGQGMTHPVVRVLGSKRWRRYEHRKITGQ
jgi:hypothetical protein